MINRNKRYTTRDGRPVKIFMTNAGECIYPWHGTVIGAVYINKVKDGEETEDYQQWMPCTWDDNGKFRNGTTLPGLYRDYDLIEETGYPSPPLIIRILTTILDYYSRG